jgi:flagellar biosynthesis/type III secretory pathway chaperone
MNPAVRQLSAETLQLLSHESGVLETMIQHIASIKAAIVARNTEQLLAATQGLQQLHQQRQRLTETRHQLRRRVATQLGIKQSVATVRHLAQQADEPTRQQLETARQRLLELAMQALQLNRGNLSLAAHFAQITQHMIELLTGAAVAPRYDKSGQLDSAQAGSTFQTDY